jgi:Putative DNA-binding domain
MLKLDTRAELDALHTGLIQESLTLEYKSSGAVDKAQSKKEEIAKDASAFANAAGGQIVYGMAEQKNLPAGLDAGLDPSEFPGIWFEQVIQQNVTPQIDGLRVKEVPLDPGHTRIAVVVTVPAAQGRAPHQAKDGRYYRRHNFSNQIMNDSEVRDTMRRATTPELFVTLQIGNGQQTTAQFAPHEEISKSITLRILIGNKSPQPAYHTNISIGLGEGILLRAASDFGQIGIPPGKPGPGMNWVRRKLSSPPGPIFLEAEPLSLSLTFAIGSENLHSSLFRLTTIVQTPGYSATEKWVMFCRDATLTLYDPTHPNTRTAG